MSYKVIEKGAMSVRRHDRRVWYIVLWTFVAMALFSFLVHKYRENRAEAASLANFDPGYIISDYQMGNYNSMNEAQIQAFLTSKNPCSNTNYNYYLSLSANKNYTWHWKDGHFVCLSQERFGDGEVIGSGDTAAHIIWKAAQDYRINPQVLIVLLQKETSLITDPIPNSGDYRKATGYGCPDTAPCSSQYYGFKNQVRKAAALFRTVLDGGWTNYPLGNNYIQYNPNASCGGSVVNIRSLATSALYRYTPYQPNAGALAAGYGTASCGAYGNRNFYLYFQDWFGGITSVQKEMKVANGTYYIELLASRDYVLDVQNGRIENGANVQLYSRNGTGAQQWNITYNDKTDDYSIINVASGLVLDVANASEETGANTQIWEYNGTCAQRWKITRTEKDIIRILSSCSQKPIEVKDGKTVNGANVELQTKTNNTTQQWLLNPVEKIEDGIYVVSSTLNQNRAIDISGGVNSARNGTNIQLWSKNNTAAQRWQIKRDKNGYYYVRNLQSGKYIDVDGANDRDGTNIQAWSGNDSCAQKWRILKTKDGFYTFISSCSLKVLDLHTANTGLGTNIQLYDANNTKAQRWGLELVSIIRDGEYQLVSALSNKKGLDLAGNSSLNGANIQLYDLNDTSAQKWSIKYDAKSDYYKIINAAKNKSIDVDKAGIINRTNIQLWDNNNSCAQKWLIFKEGGYYVFRSACSDLVLDVAGGKSSNQSNIQLFNYNGTNAQKWLLK